MRTTVSARSNKSIANIDGEEKRIEEKRREEQSKEEEEERGWGGNLHFSKEIQYVERGGERSSEVSGNDEGED